MQSSSEIRTGMYTKFAGVERRNAWNGGVDYSLTGSTIVE